MFWNYFLVISKIFTFTFSSFIRECLVSTQHFEPISTPKRKLAAQVFFAEKEIFMTKSREVTWKRDICSFKFFIQTWLMIIRILQIAAEVPKPMKAKQPQIIVKDPLQIWQNQKLKKISGKAWNFVKSPALVFGF